MRRLFIALLPLLLVACDTSEPADALVGNWELVEVETYAGEPISGPMGSRLFLSTGGELTVESGNDCAEGAFFARTQTPVGSTLQLEFGSCTEMALPLEEDLSRFIHALTYPDDDVFFLHGMYLYRFLLDEGMEGELVLQIQESNTRLVFHRVQ